MRDKRNLGFSSGDDLHGNSAVNFVFDNLKQKIGIVHTNERNFSRQQTFKIIENLWQNYDKHKKHENIRRSKEIGCSTLKLKYEIILCEVIQFDRNCVEYSRNFRYRHELGEK